MKGNYQLVKKDFGGHDVYWVRRNRGKKPTVQVLCGFRRHNDAVRVLNEVAYATELQGLYYNEDGSYPAYAKYYPKARKLLNRVKRWFNLR